MERAPVRRWSAFVLGITWFCAASAAAGPIAAAGTGGGLSILRILAAAYRESHPAGQVVVFPAIGTTGGVKALLDGKLDIGLAGRPLRDAERNAGAVEFPLARSPFAFCAHGEVPLDALSLRDVVDIYEGRKTSWPDGTPVRLILRPEGDSDLDILRGISKEMADAVNRAMRRSGMSVALHDGDAADAIERTPGAIGTLALGMVASEGRKVKALALDGVAPSAKSLAEGAYRLEKRLSLITVREPSPAVRRFLDFVGSREGSSILARSEYIPLR